MVLADFDVKWPLELLVPLGLPWVSLGGALGASWVLLGASWVLLGASWVPPGLRVQGFTGLRV